MADKMTGRWLALGLVAAASAAVVARMTPARYCFRNKVVLITGGSRGLGFVLARQLLAQGAIVALCGRNDGSLGKAADELEQYGRLVAIPCDVTNSEQVQQLVDRVTEHFGRIDVLINNAGIIAVGPMHTMTLADFQDAMNTHFWGTVYTTLAVLPQMRRRGEGRIVNICSIGGKIPIPHLVPYCASKFAEVGLSQGLRLELGQSGIVVTTVSPGLMRTGSPRNALFKGQHRAEYAWFSVCDSIPGLSVSAERAARQVLSACQRGTADVVISIPAKLATRFHSLFPGLSLGLLAATDRLLPDGIEGRAVTGRESSSRWSPSLLTALSERAAERNNQFLE